MQMFRACHLFYKLSIRSRRYIGKYGVSFPLSLLGYFDADLLKEHWNVKCGVAQMWPVFSCPPLFTVIIENMVENVRYVSLCQSCRLLNNII